MVLELTKIDEIINKYGADKAFLIQVLLHVQRENRWLSKDALIHFSERLSVPLTQIYHIATFYKAFSLIPRGRHQVTVCLGTACHVRGSPHILERAQQFLGISPGGTTPDLKFSLKSVNCLGCCALGPVMVVGRKYHGKLSVSKVGEILQSYGQEE